MPRIRRSLRERGVLVSLQRSVFLPLHLLQEFRALRRNHGIRQRSGFDLENQLDTDGDIEGWTYLSDLEISSPNWIYGRNYTPIGPDRFRAVISSLDVRLEDYVFVDFGSGKGRALLLGSEFPFKRILGFEFSPELQAIALLNIEKYAPHRKSGDVTSVCADFLDVDLPLDPLILFFFDPCEDAVLIKLLQKIHLSLQMVPRTAYLIYVAPTQSKRKLLDAAGWLTKACDILELRTCIYRAN